MHSFARHHRPSGESASAATKGLILKGGWRYDLHRWVLDAFLFQGKGRELRHKTAALARLQPGEQVLDVGYGTGTLALEVARLLGSQGCIWGIGPSAEQIERAHTKAARRHLSIAFEVGVIEQLAFPDQTFDVVLSTFMLHHLPAPLKQQGLAEIARVLTGGGRLIIADFTYKQERTSRASRFHARGK